MVRDTVTDGVRIAELLSSELHGRTDGVLAHVTVTNADPDVEPSVDGERAYDVTFASAPIVDEPARDVDVLAVTEDDAATAGDDAATAGGDAVTAVDEAVTADDDAAMAGDETDAGSPSHRQLGRVFVHPDRVHVEFTAGVDDAADAASVTRLRVRPKATDPPRTLVFVESGAAVKDVADVVATVVESLLAS